MESHHLFWKLTSTLDSQLILFQIEWSHEDFRTTLFEIINQTMRGRWAETAQLETGSIIVQNLFESGNEDEKVRT